jgi:hypothetical protein
MRIFIQSYNERSKAKGIAAEYCRKSEFLIFALLTEKKIMGQRSSLDKQVFIALIKAIYLKCFGQSLECLLTEPESKHLSSEIEEHTGLVIGWKSLKNYTGFVLESVAGRNASPSHATLDTLARYVLNAPAISEINRKKQEPSFVYWFRYREQFLANQEVPESNKKTPSGKLLLPLAALLALAIALSLLLSRQDKSWEIVEDFHSLHEKSLQERGWFLLSRDEDHWEKRDSIPGHLTLYTLEGDSWRSREHLPGIHNLLTRKIPKSGFSVEVHFSDFRPAENWQQAGLLIMEDTAYDGKSIRLSLAYNDFSGGYMMPGEIIVQAVSSYGRTHINVEEIAHNPLYVLDGEIEEEVISNNLKYSALRIEKYRHSLRFLYAASPLENFSFKELAVLDFDFEPRFAGIFGLKGFVDSTSVVPVPVRLFRLENLRGD